MNYKDYIGAMSDYTKAIGLELHGKKLAKVHLNRGKLKLFLGDKSGGCLDLSEAGERGEGEAYEVIKKYCK